MARKAKRTRKLSAKAKTGSVAPRKRKAGSAASAPASFALSQQPPAPPQNILAKVRRQLAAWMGTFRGASA